MGERRNVLLTSSQQEVLDKLQNFIFGESDEDIFVLKGYAGTGKTTLLGVLVDKLEEQKVLFSLLAPTGRAAKVLYDKTGFGATIHRFIYASSMEFKEVENEDLSVKSYRMYFPLRKSGESIRVLIVDESSMVSDVRLENELYQFGSGRLLTDLLEFAGMNGMCKIVFVGDDAQLPPVGEPFSKALQVEYLTELGHHVASASLTEVVRQKGESGILGNAESLREALAVPQSMRRGISLQEGDGVYVSDTESCVKRYLEMFSCSSFYHSAFIMFSNAQCYEMNSLLRQALGFTDNEVGVGDLLLLNSNSYSVFGKDMYNGDLLFVAAVGKRVTRTAPVVINKKREQVVLTFRKLTLFYPQEEQQLEVWIHEGLLNSRERDLSVAEQKALYIDFCIRWHEMHKNLQEKEYREGSEWFRNALKSDPYFNALKVKYGYAMTCHKAQGGEWDNVYVDFTNRNGTSDEVLRWCYTACTRARKNLYMIHPPKAPVFDKLVFHPVASIGKTCKNFYPDEMELSTPFHTPNVLPGVRIKYWEICSNLQGTSIRLEQVTSYQYKECYVFRCEGLELRQECYYDGNGLFKWLDVPDHSEKPEDVIKRAVNRPVMVPYKLNYVPGTDILKELYDRMRYICEECEVQITNVKEELDKYYVLYCLKTDARFASIQFYMGKNGLLTMAMPKSDSPSEDMKLKRLIGMWQEM